MEVIPANRLLVTRSKCVGCATCELVCSLEKAGVVHINKSGIRVSDRERPAYPVVCLQCENPRCVAACATGALYRAQAVLLDRSKCTLCMACIEACPFRAIWFDVLADAIVKCDTCEGRFRCASFCPTGALSPSGGA